ncbi:MULTISPECIES: hypothetical protein [unclassified Carboxylicivirga]|uniref:hypothetical protein n=1 Tax=Carboxylicivirga TaxID=1628153 RepID=UPI003D34DC9B
MDDLGNILYVLAMLAALVFSALKKKKQVDKSPPVPGEERPEFDPMAEDDIMGELRELFQSKAKEEQPVVRPAVKKEPVRFEKDLTKQVGKPKVMVKKKEPIRLIEDDEVYEQEQIDLRQAVIYSEILKRPYE